jgi:hypothetical protein
MKRFCQLAFMAAVITMVIVSVGCKKDPAYTRVKINSFTVTQIPFNKPGGGSWEDLPLVEGGPDVYWQITDMYDSVYYGSRDVRFDNVSHNNLPLVRVLSGPLTLTPLAASWYLKIYDYDLIGGDDLMATMGPFSFDGYKKDFPSSITLTGDSAVVILDISWSE